MVLAAEALEHSAQVVLAPVVLAVLVRPHSASFLPFRAIQEFRNDLSFVCPRTVVTDGSLLPLTS